MSSNRYNTRSRSGTNESEIKSKKNSLKKSKKNKFAIPEDDSSSDEENQKEVVISNKKNQSRKKKSRVENLDYSEDEEIDDPRDITYEDEAEEYDEEDAEEYDEDEEIYEEVDERGNIKGLIDYDDGDENGIIIDMGDPENPFNALFGSIFGGGPGGGNKKMDEYKKKIEESKMTDTLKAKMLEKLEKTQFDDKEVEWWNNLFKIPFGQYSEHPVDVKKSLLDENGMPNEEVVEYFNKLVATLDKAVYGMQNVKEEIVNYVAQTLTTSTPAPRILALHGPAGTGKTLLIREGISKALNRPMHSFSMGGIKDSSHFVGFDYTYYSSRYGALAQCLMDSKVMDPVIFLDELDKISQSHEGEEVENLLVHLTDPNQNFDFKDKYFNEVSIDYSKAIFIFSFNDITKINPILKDRLHIISVKAPTSIEKLIVVKNYVISDLLKNIGIMRGDFTITDEAIKYIINKYGTNEGGMRSIKRCIESILLKVNTIKLLGSTLKWTRDNFTKEECKIPILISENNVSKFLKSHESSESQSYLSMYN